MTEQEFEDAFDRGDLDDEYAEFLMKSDLPIGNGDMLIEAMESHKYLDSFKEEMVD